ncbi:hypothetical protein HGRIS_005986 [Hohenbuehelia grisea]|uniref:Protein kinase domain-containing protein n=1 Tax=Hohenbuehelia grisea TaxID=104357 RepID=A0ABR3JYZ1_9AGAR
MYGVSWSWGQTTDLHVYKRSSLQPFFPDNAPTPASDNWVISFSLSPSVTRKMSRDTQSTQEFLAVWRSTANVVVLQYPTSAAWQARRDSACRNLRALLQKFCRLQRTGSDWLDQVCVAEIASICNQLLYTLRTKDAAQVLLDPELAGGLQTLLHIIQMLLDEDLEPSLNRVCLSTLLELSKTYNVYPAELILQGVALEGDFAVAEGRYGAVWKAVYHAEIVAVKVIKVYRSSNSIKRQRKISHETLIWRQLCHPNVLPLLGLFFLNDDPSAIGLVSPFMENGNVHQYMARYPFANRVPLVVDIASGLHYLHSLRPKIIHGDIKGINILITPAHRACIADFGVSAMAADGCGVKPPCMSILSGGTLRWFSPELFDSGCENTLEADIYAFACVCYEVCSLYYAPVADC